MRMRPFTPALPPAPVRREPEAGWARPPGRDLACFAVQRRIGPAPPGWQERPPRTSGGARRRPHVGREPVLLGAHRPAGDPGAAPWPRRGSRRATRACPSPRTAAATAHPGSPRIRRAPTRPGGRRAGEQPGITERIGDAMRGHGILEEPASPTSAQPGRRAGVGSPLPANASRRVRARSGASPRPARDRPPRGPRGTAGSGRPRRCAAGRAARPRRPLQAMLVGMAPALARAVVPAVAAVVKAREIGVHRGGGVPARQLTRRRRTRHPRADAVGADDESGRDLVRPGGVRTATPVTRPGPVRTTSATGAIAYLGACLGGGFRQHPVEQHAARRIARRRHARGD